jgi:hypothetical protein
MLELDDVKYAGISKVEVTLKSDDVERVKSLDAKDMAFLEAQKAGLMNPSLKATSPPVTKNEEDGLYYKTFTLMQIG